VALRERHLEHRHADGDVVVVTARAGWVATDSLGSGKEQSVVRGAGGGVSRGATTYVVVWRGNRWLVERMRNTNEMAQE